MMGSLRKKFTVVIVTHSMAQVKRIADKTALFLMGKLVERGDTEKIFTAPQDKRTRGYITGDFG
jgi:phosphate transport system ATP-binding protein